MLRSACSRVACAAPCRSRHAALIPSHLSNSNSSKSNSPTSSISISPLGRRSFSSVFDTGADVVVVGAGALGASTFYHLTKSGKAGKVVLLEAHTKTAGTTWHSAGLLWRLRPNDVEIELINKTRELVKDGGELETKTGVSSWEGNGGLFLAGNAPRMEEYSRLRTLGRYYGIESHLVTPAEIQALHPVLNVDDLVGGLHSPGDGLVDPTNVTEAYIRGGIQHGGELMEKCRVEDVVVENGLVTAVRTSKGEIRTQVVVNCCGAWAPQLGAMAGVTVPLTAMHHAYVTTEAVPNMGYVPNVRDHDLSVYLKYQGGALSVGGYEPAPNFWDDVSPDFAFGLFDLDLDTFEPNMQGHWTRVPALQELGVPHTICGPESFTADHKPLMGPSAEVPNFFLGCGFNSAGIMLSGGCGEQLSHWILNGRPELDMFSYDISRFHSSLTSNNNWVRSRSHESYAKNYAIVFPHDQPLAGRRLRPNPLYERLVAAGCVHMDTHGFERPSYFVRDRAGETGVKEYDYYGAYPEHEAHTEHVYRDLLKGDYSFQYPANFDDIGREHLQARNRTAAFDMSAFGKYELEGAEAAKLVDALCTADVVGKGEWRSTYTHMLNHSGGVECDLTVSQLEANKFYICTPGGSAQHDYQWWQQVAREMGLKVNIKEVTEQRGVWSIQGRQAREILAGLTDVDMSEASFPFGAVRKGTMAGVEDVRIIRLTYAGELGFEIHMPVEGANAIYDAVHASARTLKSENGEPVLLDAGYRALETLALEKGFRHWHADLRSDDTPFEAGMGFVCLERLKAGNDTFVGADVVRKQWKEGVSKRLVYVYPDSSKPIWGLEVLYAANGDAPAAPVGFLRRAGFAHSLGKTLGVAYVTRADGGVVNKAWVEQQKFSLEITQETVDCKVELRTPFDAKNLRIKGDYSACEEIPLTTREAFAARSTK